MDNFVINDFHNYITVNEISDSPITKIDLRPARSDSRTTATTTVNVDNPRTSRSEKLKVTPIERRTTRL